ENVPRPISTTRLSKDTSKVKVYLIPTNEELVIASDTAEIVKNK
ncbi:MAG: acetate kinase, partial [Clostridia bacterium]|nr:acetate kinase [Clostridia bacterium]